MKKDVLVKKAVDSGNDSYGFKEVLNVGNDYTYDVNGNMTKDLNKGIVYENGVLQFFNHPEGYVSPKNASDISQGFKYVYQYKDHLG
ncbi:hypothetical protein V2550_15095, partial [Tenacibaculum maritimum]